MSLKTWAEFVSEVQRRKPGLAVVIGSGLGMATASFKPTASLGYAKLPDMAVPSVSGHLGEAKVGHWGGQAVLVFFGRIHRYEGHDVKRVTRLVHLSRELGCHKLLLTNSAGGIHPQLLPGEIMLIRDHFKWFGPNLLETELASVYSGPLRERLQQAAEVALGRLLKEGTYAAVTGPCFETPAEVRALAKLGADTVGMSTALEAEAAVKLGLEVAALSFVTNTAAGLADGTLSHDHVTQTAGTFGSRVGLLLDEFFRNQPT